MPPSGDPSPGAARSREPAPRHGWGPARLVGPQVTVHRQPVVAPDGVVRGYAVHVTVRTAPTGADPDEVDALVHEEYARLDLAALTGGAVAFLRATSALLGGTRPLPPSPGGLVLVVPAEHAQDPATAGHLARRRADGVGLALADLRAGDPAAEALLGLVDLVTVDLGRGAEATADAVDLARSAGLAVLVERVDTEAAVELCVAQRVDLLQGPLFPRDTTVRDHELSAGQLQCLELMQLLSAEPVDQDAVVAMVAADPELSMRVLRLVNLSAFAVRREIDSVSQAVVLVGPVHLAALAVSALVGARASTVATLWFTLSRAGACRALAHHDNAYTVGLLSAVAAHLSMSPLDLVRRTGVSDDVAAALRDRSGPWGPVLAAVLAHEADDVAGVAASGLRPDVVSGAYLDAVTAALTTATSLAGVR